MGAELPAFRLLIDFVIQSNYVCAGLLAAARLTSKGELMKSSVTNLVMALGLVAIGVAIGAAGIYIGETDDAPGAALIGIALMIGAVVLGVRIALRKNVTNT